MKNTIKLALVGAALILTVHACKGKKGTATVTPIPPAVKTQLVCSNEVTYTASVKGIMDQHCASSCHGNSGAGGIALTNYENVKSEAAKKRFLGALKHEEFFNPMPKKNPKLSDSTIQVIECWIEGGMKQ